MRLALGSSWLEAAASPRKAEGEADTAAAVRQAVYYYLNDAGSGRAGWAYPRFRRDVVDDAVGPAVEVTVAVDDETWWEFGREAERQHVSVQDLLRHALLYFAADLDAGRVAERIVDDQS